MSEPMQPANDGGMKTPPQTSPAPDFGETKTGGGGKDRSDALHDQEGGMIGEGDDGADV
jgi:hypothetical protein